MIANLMNICCLPHVQHTKLTEKLKGIFGASNSMHCTQWVSVVEPTIATRV